MKTNLQTAITGGSQSNQIVSSRVDVEGSDRGNGERRSEIEAAIGHRAFFLHNLKHPHVSR